MDDERGDDDRDELKHAATKINRVKYLTLILSISAFSPSRLHLLLIYVLNERFATIILIILLIHICSVKCLCSLVNLFAVTALLPVFSLRLHYVAGSNVYLT